MNKMALKTAVGAEAAPNVPAVPQHILDFLRGFAALYVLINHTRGGFFIGGREFLSGDPTFWDYLVVALLQTTSLGAEFVVLFFVVSGFAMAHSIQNSKGVGSFYLKRVLRIWPPYLAATAFAFLVGKLIGAEDIQKYVIQVAFYLHAETSVTPQFWSLPYEVFFYLLCPFILATRMRVLTTFSMALLLCVLMAATLGIILNPSANFFVNFFGNELAFLAAGAVSYHYLHRIPKLGLRPYAMAVVLLLVVAWVTKNLTGHINIFSSTAMVCVAAISIRNFPDRLARVRWLNLGFFSYSIYLFNYAILLIAMWLCKQWVGVDAHDITNPLVWLGVVPPVLAATYIAYLFTEAPTNRALNQLRQVKKLAENSPVPS